MEVCNLTLAGFGICKLVGYPILFFVAGNIFYAIFSKKES